MTETYPHLIDSQLREGFVSAPSYELNSETLPLIREGFLQTMATMGTPTITPEIVKIPGMNGAPEIELRIFEPPQRKSPASLYAIHGGGYVIGSAAMMDTQNAMRATQLGVVVVAVSYRLAPETVFPGPLEDCYTGFQWVVENSVTRGLSAEHIIVIGESAGGGLAAALAIMCRDLGGPQPFAQCLTYPMLDHRTGGEDDVYNNPVTGHYGWDRAKNCFGWAAMRGDYAMDDERAAWFSPALLTDFKHLPKTYIGLGALDLFLDEDFTFAQRLIRAGISVELHVYPGAPHGYEWHAPSAVSHKTFANQFAALAQWIADAPRR